MPHGHEEMVDAGRGIELCLETFGDPSDPPMILVMGLGTQMIAWHPDLCLEFVDRGFYVVRFDNRDCGRSTSVEAPPPGLRQLLSRRFDSRQYDLSDMADDVAGLMHALELAPAHIVGASLGGMVAQTVAARHAVRVTSLTSIMSSTGHLWKGLPAPGVFRWLLGPAPREWDAALEHALRIFREIGSPDYPLEAEELRLAIQQSFDRGVNRAGTARQLAAILRSGDRTKQLGTIEAPTLVIHGSADRMVRPSGGLATVAAIPNAELMTIEGMGHDLPRELWPQLVDAIVSNAERDMTEPTPIRGASR